jgi:hypothetical protein
MNFSEVFPTELICEIFNLVHTHHSVTNLAPGDAPFNGAKRLEVLKAPISSTLTLSQVCQVWRAIALNSPVLWQCLRLTFETISDDALIQVCKELLLRSRGLPLHLDISLDDFPYRMVELRDALMRKLHHQALALLTGDHLCRCVSLRATGSHAPLRHLLGAFIQREVCAPIKWLHLEQAAWSGQTPLNLPNIAPQATSVYMKSTPIGVYPKTKDLSILLSNLTLRRATHWASVTGSATHVAFRNVTVPLTRSHQTYTEGGVENREKRRAHLCTVSAVRTMEFQNLLGAVGSRYEIASVICFRQFFHESLIPSMSKTLQELRFIDIGRLVWAGFIALCMLHPSLVLARVRKLTLKSVEVGVSRAPIDEEFTHLVRLVPNLKELWVVNVGPSERDALLGKWRGGSGKTWSNLSEVWIDGVMVGR